VTIDAARPTGQGVDRSRSTMSKQSTFHPSSSPRRPIPLPACTQPVPSQIHSTPTNPNPNQHTAAGAAVGGLPDLVESLATQVREYADETLTCSLYQLPPPRPGLPSAVELLATFSRPSRAPVGHIKTTVYFNKRVLQLPSIPVPFTYACCSENAIRVLLEEPMWDPTARYWLVVRRIPQAASSAASSAAAADAQWPPTQLRIPVDPEFGFPDAPNATGYSARHRLLNDLATLFPLDTAFIKILYMEEWEPDAETKVAWEGTYDTATSWRFRMGAACAEAVYALLAEG
jgi:hypothetical protein